MLPMPYGFLDTRYIDLPANIDANYLRGLQTARGVSFAEVMQQLDARLAAAEIAVDPLVAELTTPTTQASIDGTTPTAFALEEENEYGLPRPELAEPRAHMLPIRRYAKSLGWTEDGLEVMTQATLLNQFDSMLATFVRGALVNVLTRLFSDAEVRVDRGVTATSPGFAGSGTGANAFAGSYPDGTALPGGYTHYVRDTAANLGPAVKAGRDKLKRWSPGPYDLIASQAQVDLISALPDFVPATSPLILRAQGVAAANVPADEFVGVYDDDIRVRLGRLELGTEPNIAIYKSYGDFHPRNPLAWRYDEDFGRGVKLRSRSLYPLDQAVLRQRYGIGVNNRTAAVLIRIGASGPYVAPVVA